MINRHIDAKSFEEFCKDNLQNCVGKRSVGTCANCEIVWKNAKIAELEKQIKEIKKVFETFICRKC